MIGRATGYEPGIEPNWKREEEESNVRISVEQLEEIPIDPVR